MLYPTNGEAPCGNTPMHIGGGYACDDAYMAHHHWPMSTLVVLQVYNINSCLTHRQNTRTSNKMLKQEKCYLTLAKSGSRLG